MGAKTDLQALHDPFLDRRCKLLPCQKEMILYWYNYSGESLRQLARRFKVDRRTIEFVLFPAEKDRNVELRKARGGHRLYYDRVLHAQAMKEHRDYKKKLLK